MADNTSILPRAAAAIILVRSGDNSPEILLLKRSASAPFMPNAYVFAGGAVDAADESFAAMDDGEASRRLRLPSNGLRFFVAAIREAFEECGLLLAYDSRGEMVDLGAWTASDLTAMRGRLSAGEVDLGKVCNSHGWRPAADAIIFYSHWITPVGPSRRYDTRFFIGCAPRGQCASLAGTEMSDLVWRTAADALADHAAGRLLLMYATRQILQGMTAFDDLDALMNFARSKREILPIMPVLRRGCVVE